METDDIQAGTKGEHLDKTFMVFGEQTTEKAEPVM